VGSSRGQAQGGAAPAEAGGGCLRHTERMEGVAAAGYWLCLEIVCGMLFAS
jgi:hypothetical protein